MRGLAGKHRDQLDSSTLPLQQEVDEIADYQIGFPGAPIHNAAGQNPGRGAPLNVDRAAATQCPATQFGPTRRTARLSLQQYFEVVSIQLCVICYRVAHA
jgi:hypothetical protein